MWPLNTGDCLIEVTTSEGWTVLHFNIDNMIYVWTTCCIAKFNCCIIEHRYLNFWMQCFRSGSKNCFILFFCGTCSTSALCSKCLTTCCNIYGSRGLAGRVVKFIANLTTSLTQLKWDHSLIPTSSVKIYRQLFKTGKCQDTRGRD